MEPVRPEFAPDPSLSREEMERLQYDVAAAATFSDDLSVDPAVVGSPLAAAGEEPPVVAGVDQAFLEDRGVSAIVASRGGEVIERVGAVADLEIPYVPGLLSFREGAPILAAFGELSVDPDLVVFDGSGRIHFRQAGLATHMGVILDVPSVGVAKNLLCGSPRRSTEGLAEGETVPIEADGEIEGPGGDPLAAGTVVGHAVQSRQYDSPDRHINPLIVSPGHRVGADAAADLALALTAGYKLPEPTRRADAHADELKADHE